MHWERLDRRMHGGRKSSGPGHGLVEVLLAWTKGTADPVRESVPGEKKERNLSPTLLRRARASAVC